MQRLLVLFFIFFGVFVLVLAFMNVRMAVDGTVAVFMFVFVRFFAFGMLVFMLALVGMGMAVNRAVFVLMLVFMFLCLFTREMVLMAVIVAVRLCLVAHNPRYGIEAGRGDIKNLYIVGELHAVAFAHEENGGFVFSQRLVDAPGDILIAFFACLFIR